ncbi:MAG: tetratricopeptide repeat protein [Myxococcales bacterium]|nr:tetratricopeptide repeat protein [Myxococcales bacterium]
MGSEASIPFRASQAAGAAPEPAALASAAHALCDAGRAAEAETIARWLIHQHPNFSGGQIVLGRVLFEQDRLDEAADILRATTIQYPASVAAYRWLSEVLVRQGRWARARAVLNQAVMLSPANRRLGQLQMLAGQAAQRQDAPANVIEARDDSTTRAMNLATPLPPPIPVQGREPRSRLSEDDPTPTGIAPPETPLYARRDFRPEPAQEAPSPAAEVRRTASVWPPPLVDLAPPAEASRLRAPESAVINVAPTSRPRDFEHTPSVTWKGIPVLDQHWRRRWPRGLAWGAALVTTAALGFGSLRWMMREAPITATMPEVPKPAPREAPKVVETRLPQHVELMLSSPASLREVLKAREGGSEPAEVASRNLAASLLRLDYGEPLGAPGSDTAPDALEGELADAALATAVFNALAEGKLDRAGALVQGAQSRREGSIWIPLAQARLLQRQGNLEGARDKLATLPDSDATGPRLLHAELALDAGQPSEALEALAPLEARNPTHPRLRQLAFEAEQALRPESAPAEVACTPDLPPNQLMACTGRLASHARRTGDRNEAARRLAQLAKLEATDPRILAEAVVTLSQIGQSGTAHVFLERLRRMTAQAFPAREWAELAWALGRGPANVKQMVPPRPWTAETRLLAARAAYARGNVRALAATLQEIGETAVRADDDLRWWRLLSRQTPASSMVLASRLRESRKPLGPVGTFVAGLLAENSRRLTSHFMGQALATPNHADRCWAASVYARAQRNLGRDPTRLPALRTLVEGGFCN